MRRRITGLCWLLLATMPWAALAGDRTSASYGIRTEAIGAGGGMSGSADYMNIGELASFGTVASAPTAGIRVFPGLAGAIESLIPLSILDTDGDGMTDEYEHEHNFNPSLAADARADADGDGMSNLEEYLAGTDPRNANSILKVHLQLSGSDARILFTGLAGKRYRVEYCDRLGIDAWQPLGSALNGPGLLAGIDAQVGVRAGRFYRVRVDP